MSSISEPAELWRVNVPGQAIVRCLIFEQAGVWGVALKVNNQTEDVKECATREQAVRQGEEWRRTWPDRVLDRPLTDELT